MTTTTEEVEGKSGSKLKDAGSIKDNTQAATVYRRVNTKLSKNIKDQ
jgi:hypothetical protein